MKLIKKIIAIFGLWVVWLTNLSICNIALADNPYDDKLNQTLDSTMQNVIKSDKDVINNQKWDELFNSQVNALVGYIIDMFIVIGIAVAFIGGYKIMVSDKDDALKEWIKLVIFWILWIIIMVSAKFIANSLVWESGIISTEFGSKEGWGWPNWIQFANNLYQNIIYPFIKIALYLVIWVLFFVMAWKVVSFVISTDDSVKKKAGGVIIWCVVGILIIMWSKQIVEAVMWSQESVLSNKAEWISGGDKGMWEEILEFGSVPIIAQVINWVMWLTMFAIVILIIIQWYKIFTKPDDPKTREGMKKAILYILIWVLVIGAAYVISRVLVVNNVAIDTVS